VWISGQFLESLAPKLQGTSVLCRKHDGVGEEQAAECRVTTVGMEPVQWEQNVVADVYPHQLGFLYSRSCAIIPGQRISVSEKRKLFTIPCKLCVVVANPEAVLVKAGEDIPANIVLLEYIGEVMTLSPNTASSSARELLHTQPVNRGKYVINSSRVGSVSRLLRHSDTPNLIRFEVLGGAGEPGRLFFHTARNIQAGDELTIQKHPKASFARSIFQD